MKEPTSAKEVARNAALVAAGARQIASGEHVAHAEVIGKQHVAVTDRRIVITAMGMMTGETGTSFPLGTIAGLTSTVKEGRIVALNFAVPGRMMGEYVLSGGDLGRVHAALIRGLPTSGGR